MVGPALLSLRLPRPPLLERALAVLQKMAPVELAASWDNVGLLLDAAPDLEAAPDGLRILLTNDLTELVAQEAICKRVNLVVTYHPTPFGKQNKFTRENAHTSRVIIAMLRHGVSVYSPHTAFDCVRGGVNDWLIQSFPGCPPEADCVPVEPTKQNPDVGFGRWATLDPAPTLAEIVSAVKAYLGVHTLRQADGIRVDEATQTLQRLADGERRVTQVAVCAGSGGVTLKAYIADMRTQKVPPLDVFLSGEMSHHDVLEGTQNGITILLTEHSNSERGFLTSLRGRLETALREGTAGILGPEGPVEVLLSESDQDPLYVV